jgi:hypothetical protein
MAGGGGGGIFVNRTPEELSNLVRRAEERATSAAFEAELARTFGELLADYNSRDEPTARTRINDLKYALQSCMQGSFDHLFGGSVAKHTYVEGLSDVDSLIIISDSELEKAGPRQALEKLTQVLRDNLPAGVTATHGRMAVTVTYEDGMVLQLLPALRGDDGAVRVPSSRRDDWSRIDPISFERALTKRNEACGGKLVPTIKLAKAINGQLPEGQRLSGYHIESLAIAAFRDYAGPKTTSAMLPVFFERAKSLVLSPIRDSTGQSVHVDEYLGPADSLQRQTASHVIGRLARRMRNATAGESKAQWLALFGLDA